MIENGIFHKFMCEKRDFHVHDRKSWFHVNFQPITCSHMKNLYFTYHEKPIGPSPSDKVNSQSICKMYTNLQLTELIINLELLAQGVGGRRGTPSWESVGMRCDFVPHSWHLDNLSQIWPCPPFYSALVGSHFESPPFSACRRFFCGAFADKLLIFSSAIAMCVAWSAWSIFSENVTSWSKQQNVHRKLLYLWNSPRNLSKLCDRHKNSKGWDDQYLTHGGRETHICVNKQGHHWSR